MGSPERWGIPWLSTSPGNDALFHLCPVDVLPHVRMKAYLGAGEDPTLQADFRLKSRALLGQQASKSALLQPWAQKPWSAWGLSWMAGDNLSPTAAPDGGPPGSSMQTRHTVPLASSITHVHTGSS